MTESALRVGVFGGSFNPPHLAHQMLIRAALATDAVDVVWMIPTFQHAFGKDLVSYDDRLAMCERIAVPFGNQVVVSRLESELGGQSRTLRLIERLAVLLPEASFRLVIGADILAEAHKWHRWEDVARLAPPLVFGRADCSDDQAQAIEDQLTLPAISSTDVRQRIALGGDVDALLPQSVVRYIVARGLYSTANKS